MELASILILHYNTIDRDNKKFFLVAICVPAISRCRYQSTGLFFLAQNGLSGYIIAMRIIAGSKKGMALLSPKTQSSRPITDRVKESLFSVLYKYDLPGGTRVADLFCGVGSMGLEALSRGAEFVTFVEKDPKVIAVLKKNIERAGFTKESKAVRANAFKVGAVVGSGMEKYDLVFVDPPYAAAKSAGAGSALSGLLDVLDEQVTAGGIVVVRTSGDVTLLGEYGQFQIAERRQWGTMAVTILSKTKRRVDNQTVVNI
jgi:16S rRNA (guanine(966)-N(2))-methyltransferase RsmD